MVKWFKSIGYKLYVERNKVSKYKSSFSFAHTLGSQYDLIIGFCEPNNGNSYYYIDGRISIDREDCFDKWSKCPICLPFPKDEKELQFLLDKIDWLKTSEGYKASNEYDMDKWVSKYPE